jgi:mannose-6-phosphate isomerase-like protein (cupin superfamily)
MVNAVSIQNAEHYTWGDDCQGWYLLKDPGIHIIQERMPPGSLEKRHIHNRARQFFYVVRGELTMILGQESLRIKAGEGLEIEPGIAHQARNSSRNDVEFIVISCPPSHDDRTNVEL